VELTSTRSQLGHSKNDVLYQKWQRLKTRWLLVSGGAHGWAAFAVNIPVLLHFMPPLSAVIIDVCALSFFCNQIP